MAMFAKLKSKLFGQKDKNSTTTNYDQGLKKSRTLFASKLKTLAARYQTINEEYFEELTEILIGADVGPKMAMTIVDDISHETKILKLKKPSEINEIILDKMFVIYTDGQIVSTRLDFSKESKTLFLLVGVNGNGKTTTIAKLAYKLKNEGKKPLLVAADTFRAGAVEQLKLWATKLDLPIVEPSKPQQDPASVVYQALDYAQKTDCDVILVDTAGRLENKINLMQELNKINKIISQKLGHEANEVLLVLDCTTGQNGVLQAQEFSKTVPLTGIVLTKMDGSSKGGIILAIKEYLNLPVKLVGFGEKETDLEEFDLDQYLYNLTKDLFDKEQDDE